MAAPVTLPVAPSRIVARLATGNLDDVTPVQLIDLLGTGGIVWNEAGAAVDFRIEGDTLPSLFHLDGANDRIGIGLAPTDGLFHIASGSAGPVTANVEADELIIEGSGNAGISILAGATGFSALRFGSSVDNSSGIFHFGHSADTFSITIQSEEMWNASPSGNVFNEAAIADLDFRVESDLNTHMFFVDAGNNSVHIDNSLLTGAGDGDLVMANNKNLRWINNAGSTSANLGIVGNPSDEIEFVVPGSGVGFAFNWGGNRRGSLREENSGMGMTFIAESSSDHGAPSADGLVLYTKDDGGVTKLFYRNTTGVKEIATV